jgi:hypothetical protein
LPQSADGCVTDLQRCSDRISAAQDETFSRRELFHWRWSQQSL